jgi:D-alanyl-lipoteichoic acid acyltransferase DltB (MBOAT superfamily)
MQAEELSAVTIILPIGISFYMFQSIGYIIDIYRNKYRAEKNFGKFALFVSFFPQVIQGPISRFSDLGHQLFSKHHFSFDNMKDGLQLAMWGYFKKLIIADRLTVIVNLVFNEYQSYSGAVIFTGVILYCIQLYCDFSGGIDIARGIAKLFGIDVVENFNRPMFATSLADFWRRWHITLGSWMKDYLFYPLALSKPFIKIGQFTRKLIKGKLGQIIPVSIVTFIVYFVIGIWHGSGVKFIVFGTWNAVIITVSLILEPVYIKVKNKLKIKDSNKAFYIFQLIRTSLIIVIGRYITRATEFSDAVQMLKITFTNFAVGDLFNGTLLNMGLTGYDFIVVLVGILVVVVVEAFAEKGKNLKEGLNKRGFVLQSSVLVIYMIVMLVFGLCRGEYIASEFIYSRF